MTLDEAYQLGKNGAVEQTPEIKKLAEDVVFFVDHFGKRCQVAQRALNLLNHSLAHPA